MKLKENATTQKLRGGYYTPKELSDFIIEWGKRDDSKILEPSCGDGVFLESINDKCQNIKYECIAIEFLNEEIEKAKIKLKNKKEFKFLNEDFYMFYENYKDKQFDLVVGNPPYIRYQYLTPLQREIQSRIIEENGMKSNKLINSWVAFLVAAVKLMSSNGKIGMVIPAELLQVAYAQDLRLYLTNNLSKITIIAFEELVFPEVQQEVVLLLGEKDLNKINQDNGEISFIETKNIATLYEVIDKQIEYKQIDHSKDKWTKYLLSNSEIKLMKKAKANKNFVYFKDIAKVDIGITTGNNKYFSVDKTIVKTYELESVVRPLIGRSFHISGIFFNEELWAENIKNDVRAYLIEFPDIPFIEYKEKHQKYILEGEERGENTGYKCGIRKQWYRIPSIWAPAAFLLRRSSSYPKFILNNINAVSTDTMHRITPKEGINPKAIVLGYYNSITFASIELEARSYGGGVLEILPGETEKILISNLNFLSNNEIDFYLNQINNMLKNDTDIKHVLNYIDDEILIKRLGFLESEIKQYRDIWNNLKNRRLNRK